MSVAPANITYLIVTITVDPKDIDNFLPAFKECFRNVIAERENFLFEVLHDDKNPGVFKFIEGWSESVPWMVEVQLNKPYYVPFVQAVEKLWIKPREGVAFTRQAGLGHLELPRPTKTPKDTTFFIVTIHINPTDLENFLKALKDSSYAGVADEKDCYILEVLHSEQEPGVVRLVEGWTQSKDKPPHEPYVGATEKFWIKPREVQVLNRQEGFGYISEETVKTLQ